MGMSKAEFKLLVRSRRSWAHQEAPYWAHEPRAMSGSNEITVEPWLVICIVLSPTEARVEFKVHAYKAYWARCIRHDQISVCQY